MDEKYYLWIQSECSFCSLAQEEMVNRKLTHITYIMDNQLVELEAVKQKWDWSTVPIIVHENAGGNLNLIGGYSDFLEWVKKENK